MHAQRLSPLGPIRFEAIIFALAVFVFPTASASWGWQDSPATPAPATTETKTFDELHKQYVGIESRLRALQEEFGDASQERRTEIRGEFATLVEQIQKLIVPLKDAALLAYKEKPNASEKVVEVLLSAAMSKISEDEYSDAEEILQLLLTNECPAMGVNDLAGITAFSQNRFDDAQTYLEKAKEEDALSSDGNRALQSLPATKEKYARELAFQKSPKNTTLPQVRLQTTQGDLLIELFENEAPNTVANFISLVEQKYYDGLTFHRVLPGFMAQGGCPIGNGSGGPGYKIPCECGEENHRHHFAGTLSMAHAGKDTGGSQFFMTFRPTPHLDGKHTVFGRVVEGWTTLGELQSINPNQPTRQQPDKILRATVVRKSERDYKPNKVD